MLSCDLHIHSTHSRDGESDISSIIKAAVAHNLDVIAITDHDETCGADEAVRCSRTLAPNLLIIPGVEISTREGHIIALGVTGDIRTGLSARETVKTIREMGGVAIAPHPFHRFRHGVGRRDKRVLLDVDAIEVFNSRYIVGQTGSHNKRAYRFASMHNISKVAGSDAHHARYVGYGTTWIDAEKNIQSVLDAIRSGKTRIVGKKTPLRSYTRQSVKNSWKKVKNLPVRRVLRKNIRYRGR